MSIRQLILSLPFVVEKKLNARDGFFTAGRMFALISSEQLLLRLPNRAGNPGVEDSVEPLVGVSIPSAWCWVKVKLTEADPDELQRMVLASHDAIRRASRRRPKSHARRRRSRSSA